MPHNPDWTRSELIIAADLLMRNEWSTRLSVSDPRLVEVSELLRRADFNKGKWKDAAYRNANSVRRKYSDFYTKHPSYKGRPTRGGELTEQVLREFLADPDGMAAEAARIRTSILAAGGLPGETVAAPSPGTADVVDEEVITIAPRSGAAFGSAEHNKLVEDASMAAVVAHYGKANCQDVSQDKVGWDITVTLSRQVLKVEVKGVSGSQPVILLTANEFRAASAEPEWILAVVTDALGDAPILTTYPADVVLRSAVAFVHRVDLRGTRST